LFFFRIPETKKIMTTRNSKKTSKKPDTPSWASTSAKRKRDLHNAEDALEAVSDRVNVEPPAKKTYSGSGFVPGKSLVGVSREPYVKKDPQEEKVSINWEERKSQVETYPNECVDHLAEEVFSIFSSVAKEVRKSFTESGPTMLWHLLPAVMDSIQSTPWTYYASHQSKDESQVMFINYTYGDRGQDLSINQKKFRMVLMSKVKIALTSFLKDYFEGCNISVVYSKKFFDGC